MRRHLRIIGIELRTSHAEAMQTIPLHWPRLTEEGVLARIPGQLSDEVAVWRHGDLPKKWAAGPAPSCATAAR